MLSGTVPQRLRRAGRPLRPPQQRGHPRDELLRTERLGHVVVGAQLQAAHAVGLLAARGEHDDRNGGSGRVAPKRLTDQHAVHARQHHVEHDEIGLHAPRVGHDVVAGRQVLDGMTGPLEIPANEIGDVLAVFDDKNTGHGSILLQGRRPKAEGQRQNPRASTRRCRNEMSLSSAFGLWPAASDLCQTRAPPE